LVLPGSLLSIIKITKYKYFSPFKPIRVLTPVAGLFLMRLGFEKIFKMQGIFKIRQSALLAITCSKYGNNFKLTCQLAEKLFETSSVR